MSFLYFLESLRNPVLDFIFSVVTLCGEETVFMACGMIVFWCFNKYKGYYLLCTGFVGTVINQFLKMIFRVPRPWVKDPNFTIVESARDAATGYSFPSGHTQSSVGLFGGLARAYKSKVLRISMIALCILTPLSRMYLGVHTPMDVLVSVCIALLLIFVAFPIFMKAEHSPKIMYSVLIFLTLLVGAFTCFVFLFNFPESVYAEQNVQNLLSAQKNAVTLLGCMIGLIFVYTIDLKFTHFETKAVWWVQIIKALGGLCLVLLTKELLRTPLEALFNGSLVARGVRYFIMVTVGGVLWPMTFKYFSKLGKKTSEVK